MKKIDWVMENCDTEGMIKEKVMAEWCPFRFSKFEVNTKACGGNIAIKPGELPRECVDCWNEEVPHETPINSNATPEAVDRQQET